MRRKLIIQINWGHRHLVNQFVWLTDLLSLHFFLRYIKGYRYVQYNVVTHYNLSCKPVSYVVLIYLKAFEFLEKVGIFFCVSDATLFLTAKSQSHFIIKSVSISHYFCCSCLCRHWFRLNHLNSRTDKHQTYTKRCVDLYRW